MISLQDRFLGALLGLACGDAVGTTVEFCPRGTFSPITDMTGAGPFNLKPGQWTDDTSMALCLAESLIQKAAFDPADQMTRYLNWWQWGYLSCTGHCFDIGNTVRDALARFQASGNPFSGSADPMTAGNGSLMRLAPVVLFSFHTPELLMGVTADSSRTTHAAPEAIESCQLFAQHLHNALQGIDKTQLLDCVSMEWQEPGIRALSTGAFIRKSYDELKGSGYCIESLEAALWCFFNTASFKEAVLAAANLGDDADTTAAITGQLAGAYYGVESIPAKWRDQIAMREDIETLASKLFELASKRLQDLNSD